MADAPEKSEAARREEEILAFWEREKIFEKSLAKRAPKGDFVFYEGPPTANGKPGIHHLESRAFKDAIPRYKTMRGYRVERRAGWDTHGLPVELEVEKELNFSGKKDIERYGVSAFNAKCRESVMRYISLWSRFTTRIGYWVEETRAYFTFDPSYMEVVWHLFAHAAKDNRVYKDYKVVPWCPRCGTALSSHELAQGYADVKDLAVTAKFELVDQPDTYLLAWTTTPWTLPGNVALAVGKDIRYVQALKMREEPLLKDTNLPGGSRMREEHIIVAKARADEMLGPHAHIEAEFTGAELIGKRYKPLFDYARALSPESEKPKFDKAFTVYDADFVTTDEGTGIVHMAVMYGADDFELGAKLGLPKVHLVAPDGRFREGTGTLAGREATDDEVTVEIVRELAHRGLLYDKGKHEHTYPFCWRCKSRLIYYARDSWYIRMTDLRDTLVDENKKIHWEPAYIRDGRMGEWLAGAKDWAISRERYWGTPLPVWQSEDGAERLVIGSIDELKRHTKKSGNRYFVMRHGEARLNVEQRINGLPEESNTLTEHGREQAVRTATSLADASVSYIYTSPLVRACETSEIVAKTLGLSSDRVITDQRITEGQFGAMEGMRIEEYEKRYPHLADKFAMTPEGAESWRSIKHRATDLLYALEEKHKGEAILLVTHEAVVQMIEAGARGFDQSASAQLIQDNNFKLSTGKAREIPFTPLPHNDDYELDLHRPYIDDVVLVSEKRTELRRVPEVMDVWFDSGAMPFAQSAQERKKESLEAFLKRVAYPADFIAEAIDQTRGWFYTLLAIGTLMGRGAPYKNVISLGHLLDAEGQKMSKSKGNVVDPWIEIEKWGVDTIRLWMYSVAGAGDSKTYDERSVREAARALSWLENCASFYELFKDEKKGRQNEQVIDRWMQGRMNWAIEIATDNLDDYKLHIATLTVTGLIKDVSQWYVRRIRDRARDGDVAALETLRVTLHTTSRLLAPFTPFLAEAVFQKTRTEKDPISVHLAAWPAVSRSWKWWGRKNWMQLRDDMENVRAVVSAALQQRQTANFEVRQPLASLTSPIKFSSELVAILAEEVNVTQVLFGEELSLDTKLTPELIRKGDERKMARAVAEARKDEGLSPREAAHVEISREGKYIVELSTGPVRFNLIRDLSRANSRDEA